MRAFVMLNIISIHCLLCL